MNLVCNNRDRQYKEYFISHITKAVTVMKVLRDQVFTMVEPPQRLHWDQRRNFESHILSKLCKVFRVEKSHTTPYHPMGVGVVEQMNHSLFELTKNFDGEII